MPRHTKQEFAVKEGISVPILDSWIYRHGLPVVRIGRRVYITDEDFAAWWEQHKKVIQQKPAIRQHEIALPTRLQKTSLAQKMRRIY